jgi:hypothetical protein
LTFIWLLQFLWIIEILFVWVETCWIFQDLVQKTRKRST